MEIKQDLILSRLKIGLWILEIDEGKPRRMYVDKVMADLLGLSEIPSPEETFEAWYAGVDEEGYNIMMEATDRMKAGEYAEAKYTWHYPDGRLSVVRCGGSRDYSYKEGLRLQGSHRDITSLYHLDPFEIAREQAIKDRYLERAKYAMIVNLSKNQYVTVKENPENEAVAHIEGNGSFSELMKSYVANFVADAYVGEMKKVSDIASFRRLMKTKDRASIQFLKKVGGATRWYRFNASMLTSAEAFVTFEDCNDELNASLFWDAISTQMLAGLVMDLNTEIATFTKKSSLISSTIGMDYTTVSRCSAIVSAFMDEEFRDEWKKFSDIESLRTVSRERRKAEFSFCSHVLGDPMWIRASQFPISDQGGADMLAMSFSHFSKDLLEKMKRDEEYRKALDEVRLAQEASRLKTQFVQNISHDIRTPLNAIVGFSQLLSMPDGFLEGTEKKQYGDYIKDSADMLMMIINDVLSMSDIERNMLNIRFLEASCNGICRRSVNCSKLRCLDDVKMYFTSEVDDNFCIETDAMRVQQVLVNYLSNACKHTTEGEIHVHCSLSENPGMVTFSVTDTGEGLPAGMADDIFERFTTSDSAMGGHGMGLNICSELSRRLGGKVAVDKSYHNGARFLLILPLRHQQD